ncbi:EFR1 family ferrodoxin [Acetobacterium bakii]|uniref:4Fe-4S ferredoxin-type domain-containing protein n=1 Tax=Acetobacterium bakii TaxID=52689 RepID=A0A0L6TVM9_9FIRM|nr:EFR1 family ferrodoxin [Acetobacterium bakii]KNZ40313.1 hypothetical protein AKG39_18120 [Acetobacterium bakii]
MAKTVLFYFTGTGNSLAIARKIAEGLTDVDVVPMLKDDAHTSISKETEKIGLIYPVYMNAVPRVVVKFIEKLAFRSGIYIFAVATHGGTPGAAGLYLYKILKRQQIPLDAYFEIEMINNTPKGVAPKPLMTMDWELKITPEKIETMLIRADSSTKDIVYKIAISDKTTSLNMTSGRKKIVYWMMKPLWYISEKSKPKLNFILDECCIGCGLCESICTTRRIKMNEGKPEWINENCNFCYACFNYCSVQAIGVTHYAKKLGRYHHPEINANDIGSQIS